MTPGPKMNASPTPSTNLSIVRKMTWSASPSRMDETEIRSIPSVRARLGPYFAAYSPAGSWNAATPRTKVAVTRPSPETFWWRSAAIREKTEETLYQFMAETNWTTMRVVTAFRFSMFLNKRALPLMTPAGFDYN